jgi:uncharacterized protein (TIGR03437 family)
LLPLTRLPGAFERAIMSKANIAVAALSLALLSGLPAAAQQPVTVTYTFSNLPLRIYPASSNIVTVATIIVPRPLKMTHVAVQVQIQYPNSGDLNVYLYSPQQTQTILLAHDCGVQNIDTTFDDSAPSAWKNACPTQPGTGPFQPDQPLAGLNNDVSSYGVWELAVQSQSNSATGWVTGFAMIITGIPQTIPIINSQTIVNTASQSQEGIVAPGEMISILGTGLGPAAGVSAPSGAWPTTLGGTTVLINGAPAPIAYSSSFEVRVQAPFGIMPGSTASLQVNSNNQASSSVALSVQSAVPAIYTLSGIGVGRIGATNQDGSANSTLHPAPKGSVIVIYASGLGAVSPQLTEGAVPPSSPLSIASGVTATVGGASAPVQFAGLAPGFPGVYQLNVQVPPGAPSGTQELIVYSNGSSSQRAATVQVQ